jgi:hypothetical protein
MLPSCMTIKLTAQNISQQFYLWLVATVSWAEAVSEPLQPRLRSDYSKKSLVGAALMLSRRIELIKGNI